MSATQTRPLRAGDLVEVRPAAEILETLDSEGTVDHVPFMPEMLQHVGSRFRVAQRAEKICDLVGPGGSRRMRDTVFLENLRCDGASHGGCQAECRIYWKEAWLRRVEGDVEAAAVEPEAASTGELAVIAAATTRPSGWNGSDEEFRCQATEAFRATERLPGRDPRAVCARGQQRQRSARPCSSRARASAVVERRPTHRVARRSSMPLGDGTLISRESLGLQPGDWVEVRSAEEIGQTLDERGFNRGLLFTPEMLASCGRTARVHKRVEKIISERDGGMLHMRNDCIMLEGLVCTGERTPGMWSCHRDSYPFWREAWLKRTQRDV